MKRLLFLMLLLSALSCKKTNVNPSLDTSNPPMINYERTGNTSNSFVEDPGPKWKWAIGDDIDPGPNYACYPTSNICFMLGPIYYRTSQPVSDDETMVSLANQNGKLKVVFDLESMTNKTRINYFSTGGFEMNASKQFPDDLAKELNLQTPYIISKGKYKIVEQTSSTMTIIF